MNTDNDSDISQIEFNSGSDDDLDIENMEKYVDAKAEVTGSQKGDDDEDDIDIENLNDSFVTNQSHMSEIEGVPDVKKVEVLKELSEDDYMLVAESREKSKKVHRRLKKNVGAVVQKDTSLQGFIVDEEVPVQKKVQQSIVTEHQGYQSHVNNIFPDIDSDSDSEPQQQAKAANKLEDFFEPGVIKAKFKTPKDMEIVNLDVPERLQKRFKGRLCPEKEEFALETQWILGKFYQKGLNKDAFQFYSQKIHMVLVQLRVNNNEIMFMWKYLQDEVCGSIFTDGEYKPRIHLDELWDIYNYDKEWSILYPKRTFLQGTISNLSTVYDNKITIPQSITQLLTRESTDLHLLDLIQDYIKHQEEKFRRPKIEEETGRKKPSKTSFSLKVMEAGIIMFCEVAAITADDLSRNLDVEEARKVIRVKDLKVSPIELAEQFVLKKVNLLTSSVELVLKSAQKYMELDLFYHPLIRTKLLNKYFYKAQLSTFPTIKGNQRINIYTPHYRIKRIQNYNISEMTDDLFLEILECETQGLITLKFHYKWNQNNEQNKIMQYLTDRYFSAEPPLAKRSELEEKISQQWVQFRIAVMKGLYLRLIPFLETEYRKRLFQIAQRHVIRKCQRKFYSLINTGPYKKKFKRIVKEPNVLSVVMESKINGQVALAYLNSKGQVVETLTLSYFSIRNTKYAKPQKKKCFEEDKQKIRLFLKKNYPDMIVIGATTADSLNVKVRISDILAETKTGHDTNDAKDFLKDNYSPNSEDVQKCQKELRSMGYSKKEFQILVREVFVPWIFQQDITFAQIYAKSEKSKVEFKDFNILLRTAVYFGRYIQNPMALILNLWNDDLSDNKLLLYNFHPLQKMVTPQLLINSFEETAVEVVNSIGLNLNRIIQYPHLQSLLQFICGLGPRKTAHLITDVQNKCDRGFLANRMELLQLGILNKTVMNNCCGFLKVVHPKLSWKSERVNLLDTTRLSINHKQYIKKLLIDAFNFQWDRTLPEQKKNRIFNELLQKAFKEHEKFSTQNFQLRDFADSLVKSGRQNVILLLTSIVRELQAPFKDERQQIDRLEDRDLFYNLIKETPETFRKGMLVTAKITEIIRKGDESDWVPHYIKVILENNIRGSFTKNDAFDFADPQFREDDWTKIFKEGQIIKGRIKNIVFEKRLVTLSVKQSILDDHESFLRAYYDQRSHRWFKSITSEDFPRTFDSKNILGSMVPRKINHPKFKNVSLNNALTLLQNCKIGDFIIRPSSRGRGFLTLTWRFGSQSFVHLPIKENKTGGKVIYFLGQKIFDSLDEIIEQYVEPCNDILHKAKSHQKFVSGTSLLKLTEEIKILKQQEKSNIPYRFCYCQECPQYIVLIYMNRPTKVEKEYIKVLPEGLLFHKRNFMNLTKLIMFFKSNFQTDEYQRQKRKARPPIITLGSAFNVAEKKNQSRDRQRRSHGRSHGRQQDNRERSRSKGAYDSYRRYERRDQIQKHSSYE